MNSKAADKPKSSAAGAKLDVPASAMTGATQGAVVTAYQAELAARGYVADDAQLNAIVALQHCADEWAEYKDKRSNAFKRLINRVEIPKGVYMYGGVGRVQVVAVALEDAAYPLM